MRVPYKRRIDVARKWYPINILEEICAYASWWKMSEFVGTLPLIARLYLSMRHFAACPLV